MVMKLLILFSSVALRPPTPSTPDYSLESYFPPAGTSEREQRNMALMSLQNMEEAEQEPPLPVPSINAPTPTLV